MSSDVTAATYTALLQRYEDQARALQQTERELVAHKNALIRANTEILSAFGRGFVAGAVAATNAVSAEVQPANHGDLTLGDIDEDS